MAKIISIPTYVDSRGSLSVIEKILPFNIKRVFYIYDVNDSERGYHAHKKTTKALILINGSCDIYVGSQNNPIKYELESPAKCLLLNPEDNLKSISENNINFLGSINNNELPKYFSNNNFLILPSYSEPWGLVVEEALYNGVPVIISKNCGSLDLIENNINGYVFNPFRQQELFDILNNITDEKYQFLKSNIAIDFIEQKDNKQVNSYLD
jgi:glycosyltransferase involved in cell wall biosynthesis